MELQEYLVKALIIAGLSILSILFYHYSSKEKKIIEENEVNHNTKDDDTLYVSDFGSIDVTKGLALGSISDDVAKKIARNYENKKARDRYARATPERKKVLSAKRTKK